MWYGIWCPDSFFPEEIKKQLYGKLPLTATSLSHLESVASLLSQKLGCVWTPMRVLRFLQSYSLCVPSAAWLNLVSNIINTSWLWTICSVLMLFVPFSGKRLWQMTSGQVWKWGQEVKQDKILAGTWGAQLYWSEYLFWRSGRPQLSPLWTDVQMKKVKFGCEIVCCLANTGKGKNSNL